MLTYLAAALLVLLPLAALLRGASVHAQLGIAASVLAVTVAIAAAWQLVAPETAAAALRPDNPPTAAYVVMRTTFLGLWIAVLTVLALAHFLLARFALAPPRGLASGLVLVLVAALATNQAAQVSANTLTRFFVQRQGIDGMATGMRIALTGMSWGLFLAETATLTLAALMILVPLWRRASRQRAGQR